MLTKSDFELELLGQVLGQILSLKRESINFKNNGYYWLALDRLRTLINDLVLTKEEYEKFDEIIEKINKIEIDASNIKGQTHTSTKSYREQYKNEKANEIYNDVLREIQRHLTDMGYYSFIHNYNKFIDPSKGRKSGSYKK